MPKFFLLLPAEVEIDMVEPYADGLAPWPSFGRPTDVAVHHALAGSGKRQVDLDPGIASELCHAHRCAAGHALIVAEVRVEHRVERFVVFLEMREVDAGEDGV